MTPDAPAQAHSFRADTLLAVLALAAAVLVVAVLWLKTTYPSPGFRAEAVADGWRVTALLRQPVDGHPGVNNLSPDWLGQTLVQACAVAAPGQCVPLQPDWLVDTPMQLPSASAQQRFITTQQQLLGLGRQVVVHDTAGRQALLDILPGGKLTLDERIGMQVVVVLLLIYALGCVMLAFVRRTPEVWLAFAMCAGYFLYMLARVWYTSRTWAQPELGWHTAMAVFKIGVLTCGVSTAVVMWRLCAVPRWMPWLYGILAVCAGVVVLHAQGAVDSVFAGYKLPLLVCLLLIVAAALYAVTMVRSPAGQNPKNTPKPAPNKLQAKVTLHVIGLGFAPILAMTLAWNFRPDLPQIAFLLNFAVASAALPVVILVTRAAHYGLQRFWWGLWLVLAASTLGVVAAGVMTVLSGLQATTALVLGLVMATWIIYLLRAWLEKRMLGRPIALQDVVPKLMALSMATDQAQLSAWRKVLVDVFEPYAVRTVRACHAAGQWHGAELLHAGDALCVNDIAGDEALLLSGAARFTRSFTASDLKLVQTMRALAMQGLAARQSFANGAIEERKRIAADLHDDIGGKLLHLANTPGADGAYARNTLEDLRTITRGLSAQSRQLHELLSDLRYQLALRAERHGLDFDWTAALTDVTEHTLGARQGTVLASICSELLRNAMQAGTAKRVQFVVQANALSFNLQVSNDGAVTNPQLWQPGLGSNSIRRRVNELQGQCAWHAREGGGVDFLANWPMRAWLHADAA